MRVFVTGANGGLGRAIVRSLVARGHEVLGLVKDEAKKKIVADVGGKPVVGDLDNPDTYQHAKDVDVIVHTAQADYYRKRVTPSLTQKVGAMDVAWTRNLIKAGAGRATCFIYTSTAFVYGDTKDTLVDEVSPLHSYRFAGWKAANEKLALEESKQNGYKSAVVFRPGMVYSDYTDRGFFGNGILGPMLAGKPAGYHSKGDQWFSMIHDEDLGELYAQAVEKQPGFAIYNAVDNEPVKNAEWFPYLAQKVGAKKPMGFPTIAIFVLMGRYSLEIFSGNIRLSNKKAQAELNWKPKYPSYREGMTQVANELAKHGRLRKEV